MTQPIADLRINYDKATLSRADLAADPLDQFRAWLDEAITADILEPNSMTLATCSFDKNDQNDKNQTAIPSARIVLLKKLDSGFCFFTNYESDKANDIAANPYAALVFYWDVMHRSVRVVGNVEKMTAEASVAYYHSRPRGSQLGAWTSPQSRPIANRAELDGLKAEVDAQFADVEPLPIPPSWGGYRVVPHTIEFWQGRPSRLHDRFRYTRQPDGTWLIERLAP